MKIDSELRDAAIARAVKLTKSGRVVEQHRLPVIDKRTGKWVTKTYSIRSRHMGQLAGKTVVWCPWCDHDGTEVRHGPDYGPRLDTVITDHLRGCAGFNAGLAEAMALAA